MDQNPSVSDSLAEKWNFLQKYDSTSKLIKPHTPCYAVSNEWWANLECLIEIANMDVDTMMGNPGPINNLSLVNINNIYQELVHSKGGHISTLEPSVLDEMNDWDHMTIKSDIKYKSDFVLISAPMWKFLKDRFGAGPEIELIPEIKPDNTSNYPLKVITSDEEPYLDENLIVSLDLIKVYVTKDHDFASAKTKYVAPTIIVQDFITCLCNQYHFPPNKATLLYKNQQDGLINLDDKQAKLSDFNIQDGAFLTLSHSVDSLLGYSSQSGYQESIQQREDDIDSLRANEDEERPFRHQFSQDSEFGGNYSTNSRDSTDSAKLSTGSTNPHPNPLDFSEYMLGDDFPANNVGQNGRSDFVEMKDMGGDWMNSFGTKFDGSDMKEQNHPQLDSFIKRSKQALDKQKIKLEFKPLNQIRSNLINIQHEWNVWTNNNINKKI